VLSINADVVFPRSKLAIFIDGCFWHGCPMHYTFPRTRREFWSTKLASNVERDCRQNAMLVDAGWSVLRFWEHEIYKELDDVISQILKALDGVPPSDDRGWRVVRVEPINGQADMEIQHLIDIREPSCRKTIKRLRTTTK